MCALTRDLVNKWRRTHSTARSKLIGPVEQGGQFHAACERLQPPHSGAICVAMRRSEREFLFWYVFICGWVVLLRWLLLDRTKEFVWSLRNLNFSMVLYIAGLVLSMKLFLLMKIDTMSANLDITRIFLMFFLTRFLKQVYQQIFFQFLGHLSYFQIKICMKKFKI